MSELKDMVPNEEKMKEENIKLEAEIENYINDIFINDKDLVNKLEENIIKSIII